MPGGRLAIRQLFCRYCRLPDCSVAIQKIVTEDRNNGNNQVKKEIVVDGIASTTVEEIPLKINDLDVDDNTKSENKV